MYCGGKANLDRVATVVLDGRFTKAVQSLKAPMADCRPLLQDVPTVALIKIGAKHWG